MTEAFDHIIVGGGYLFEDLTDYAIVHLAPHYGKSSFVFNPKFDCFGSGCSLFLGLEEARKFNPDEIVFVEGDLFFEREDFAKLEKTNGDAISVNAVPIESDKAVVIYVNENRYLNYIYDDGHKSLSIEEPFISIHNSGQSWKFSNMKRLYGILSKLSPRQIEGTNLEIIDAYFKVPLIDDISVVLLRDWINCNTLKDYAEFLRLIKLRGRPD